MRAVEQLAPTAGIAQACQVLGVPRSSFYRAHQPPPTPAPRAWKKTQVWKRARRGSWMKRSNDAL